MAMLIGYDDSSYLIPKSLKETINPVDATTLSILMEQEFVENKDNEFFVPTVSLPKKREINKIVSLGLVEIKGDTVRLKHLAIKDMLLKSAELMKKKRG